jgi:hypothetical protein
MIHPYVLDEAPEIALDSTGKFVTVVGVTEDGTTALLTMPSAALEKMRKDIGRAIALRDQANLGQ